MMRMDSILAYWAALPAFVRALAILTKVRKSPTVFFVYCRYRTSRSLFRPIAPVATVLCVLNIPSFIFYKDLPSLAQHPVRDTIDALFHEQGVRHGRLAYHSRLSSSII